MSHRTQRGLSVNNAASLKPFLFFSSNVVEEEAEEEVDLEAALAVRAAAAALEVKVQEEDMEHQAEAAVADSEEKDLVVDLEEDSAVVLIQVTALQVQLPSAEEI